MPSLVHGFEYDIFISYRQKDNKGDRWVNEFVEALKTELESTFKEDISIYFDINPHDGLHDHHDVDESLREKVKCLVFIPIVSRTYCDPNSFAWKFEFSAFVDQAKTDPFGLKVKLPNGNVANRVLPIRIHELEKTDTALFESVSGGVMRAIDFVYKSTGVNRPLRHHEEHSDENQNHIIYRDQINKVANAISEIISAMKVPSDARKTSPEKIVSPQETTASTKSPLKKIIAVALLIAASLTVYYFFGGNAGNLDASKSSIAIIPFRNNTGDESKDFYGVGIASEVSTKMGLTKQFDFVSSLQATVQYQQTNDPPVKIGKELGVTHILSGMYQTAGDNIQVTVELIDAGTGKVLWNFPFRTKYDDIFELQAAIASKVMDRFSVTQTGIDEASTKNLDAYYHYRRGWEIDIKSNLPDDKLKAMPELTQAIQLDSGFIDPWEEAIFILAYSWFNGSNKVTRQDIELYINYVKDHFRESWKKKRALANYEYYVLRNYTRALEMYLEVLEENPEANTNAGPIYRRKLKLDKAFEYISKEIKRSPTLPSFWSELRAVLSVNGDAEGAEKAAEKLYSLNSNLTDQLYGSKMNQSYLEELPEPVKNIYGNKYKADLLLQQRDYQTLGKFLNSVSPDTAFGEPSKNYYKAITHFLLHRDDSAKYYAKQFVNANQENSTLFNAYFRSLEMNSILGKRKEADDLITSNFSRQNLEEDLQTQWTIKAHRMHSCVLSLEYEKANKMLKEMNRNYPQVGNYNWLNLPIYDRIKKEHPPFLEAINQLKYPPKVMEDNVLKW